MARDRVRWRQMMKKRQKKLFFFCFLLFKIAVIPGVYIRKPKETAKIEILSERQFCINSSSNG